MKQSRVIDDTVQYIKQKNMKAVLVLLDFAKAYDSVIWDYMIAILCKFNFSNDYIEWIEVCYKNILSTVVNNGYSGSWLKLHKGMTGMSFFQCIICNLRRINVAHDKKR